MSGLPLPCWSSVIAVAGARASLAVAVTFSGPGDESEHAELLRLLAECFPRVPGGDDRE